jgi:hypothetical protein
MSVLLFIVIPPGKQPAVAALSKSVPLFAPLRALLVSADPLALPAHFCVVTGQLQILGHA